MTARSRILVASALTAGVFFVSACGGGSSKSATSTAEEASSTPARSATSAATASAANTAETAAATTVPGQAPPAAGNPADGQGNPPAPAQPPAEPPAPAPAGPAFSAEQAQSLLGSASLLPKDLPAGWTVMSDATQDNIAAAAADPAHAASIQRCGRLLARTVANQPADVVAAYLGGQTVSFFSTLTVYGTTAGAADCAAETAQRYVQPGELARAFGQLFVDPNAVKIAAVSYPTVGDASFAATLTGLINAAGTQVDLTILIVGFRKGNVTGAVGSAAAAAPATSELKPYVDLVLQRISAAAQ